MSLLLFEWVCLYGLKGLISSLVLFPILSDASPVCSLKNSIPIDCEVFLKYIYLHVQFGLLWTCQWVEREGR